MFIKILFVLVFAPLEAIYGQCNNEMQTRTAKEYNLNDSLLCIWRADANGCSMGRRFICDSLIKKESIIGMPENILILLFGKPDYDSKDGVLTYGVGLVCDDKKNPVEDASGTELVLTIKNERVTDFGYCIIN